MPIRVAFIAAECEPWAKTGGLADVVDALARALGSTPRDELESPVDVYLPRYHGMEIPPDRILARRMVRVADPDGHTPGGRAGIGGSTNSESRSTTEVDVIDVEADGYRLRLVDHPASFDRSGGYYGDASGDYPDNAARFATFCRAALEVMRAEGRMPDVLHLHDWHAAPMVRYAPGGVAGPATLLTVHNLAYHGWVSPEHVPELGAEWVSATPAGEGVDLLRAAIHGTDLVNTVSPGFAAEALTPGFGMGLDGDLQRRGDRFFGILNGLDTDLWDPATDGTIAAPYSQSDRSGKALCRADLLTRLGMDPADGGPVLGMIGRLDPQKGFDLLAEAAPRLHADGIRLVVQGSGPPELVGGLRRRAELEPDRVVLIERFDRDMARRIYAGVDGFLMPSRFEPCGTGQMVSLRYGTPPVVHATGGLADTVIDEAANPGGGTGFVFRDATADDLVGACRAFATAFRTGGPSWEALLDRGMAVDFDWRTASAPAYVAAYQRAVQLRMSDDRGARAGR